VRDVPAYSRGSVSVYAVTYLVRDPLNAVIILLIIISIELTVFVLFSHAHHLANYLSSDLRVSGEVASKVDWISCARSASTLVFNTVPPSPRIAPNITSISTSRSRTKRADVPGFISSFISLTVRPFEGCQ